MRWGEIKEARAWTNDPGRCTMVTVNALCDHFGKERPDQTRAPMHGVGVLELIRAAGLKFGMVGTIYDPQRETVRAWIARHPRGAFYISTAGHAMAVIDGKLFDATGRGADRRIVQTALEVYETERVAEPPPIVINADPVFESYGTRANAVREQMQARAAEMGITAAIAVSEDNVVSLENINVPAEMRGRGLARQFVGELCNLCDDYGVTIYTYPHPYEKNIGYDDLRIFYQKFGFEKDPDSDDYMVRRP
jgi:GNAT superfamily N-acetyltransferase